MFKAVYSIMKQIGTSFAVTCAGIGLSVMIVAVGKGAEVEKRLLATATRDILQQGEAERRVFNYTYCDVYDNQCQGPSKNIY